jgi:MFS family permease
LAQFAPFLVLFLVAGAAADRFQRATILGVCVSLQTVCSLLLLVFTATSTVDFPRIFAVLILLGMARAFQNPAQQAIVPILVPQEHFANALAWTATGNQLARIGGPALAGGLLILGQEFVYLTALGCFALAAILTFLIRANTQLISKARPSWFTLLAGFRFIWARQIILGAIALDLFAVLLGGATALLPIYAIDILQVGEIGFGSLRASHVVGAFAAALALTQRPVKRRAGVTLLAAVVIFGTAIVTFGLSTYFWLSLAALCIMGAADAISVFIRTYVVQIMTPDDMRGRVSAVNSVFIGASNELGEFESGLTAAWWGVVPAVVIGGLGTIAVTGLFAWLLPQLRTVDSLDYDDLVGKYG